MLLTQLLASVYILGISGKYVHDCIISLTGEDFIFKKTKNKTKNPTTSSLTRQYVLT
jgi:hypothetical protein